MPISTKFDLVAIGDTAIDAFIKLSEASLNCDINKEKCQICLNFGGKIPYESVTITPATGNSANVAIGASRLGLKTALISAVGSDSNGQDCLATLETAGVNIEQVTINQNTPTNYHYVLWYENDRTILTKHEKYNYKLDIAETPTWVYLSSLGDHSLEFHETINTWLTKNPTTKLAFQPGTFQIKLGYEKMRAFYERAEILFCNKNEAQQILNNTETDWKKLAEQLANLGPKVVAITNGEHGALAYEKASGQAWTIPAYPNKTIERTGAGDAFATTFLASLHKGLTIPEALARGPINSASVIEKIGAQAGLLTMNEIEERLKNAPEGYKVVNI